MFDFVRKSKALMSHVYQGLIFRAQEGAALDAFQRWESLAPLRLCRFTEEAFGIYVVRRNEKQVNPTEDLLRLAAPLSSVVGAANFYKWASGTGHHVSLFVEGQVYCRLLPLIDYAQDYPQVDHQWTELHQNLCLDDLSEANDLWVEDRGALLPNGPRLLSTWNGSWNRPIAVATGIWPSGDEPLLKRGAHSGDALRALGIPVEIAKRFDAAFNHDVCGWIAEKV